jgi:GT2 family glycosyltransferase
MMPLTACAVLFVEHSDVAWACRAIDSICDQSAELDVAVLLDDASSIRMLNEYLQQRSLRSVQITIINTSTQDISDSLRLYDWLLILDSDCCLVHNAFDLVTDLLLEHSNDAVIYFDELTVSGSTESQILHRTQFSIERFLGHNYISGFVAINMSLLRDKWEFGIRTQSQTVYEAVLHAYGLNMRIHHSDHVLHLRQQQSSENSRELNLGREKETIERWFASQGNEIDVVVGQFGTRQIIRPLKKNKQVSIIIPTAGKTSDSSDERRSLVHTCVNSLVANTQYHHYEILIIHDNPQSFEDYELDYEAQVRTRVIPYILPFNFSDKCNLGAAISKSEVLIFLNDDTTVLSPNWIEGLLSYLEEEDVGAVGPLLLHVDNTIQSAGICNNPGPRNHSWGRPRDYRGYGDCNLVAREVSGLNGACFAVSADLFFAVGGLSNQFPNNFNDLDFCFKLLRAGYRLIFDPFVQISHIESASRDPVVLEDESEKFRRRWGRFYGRDKLTLFTDSVSES